jgi:RNA polymerase sigma factor (sigma-70 family)
VTAPAASDPNPSALSAVAAGLVSHRDALRGFIAARLGGRSAEVDEVLQRVCVRALERAGDLRDPGRARAWLYRLTRNEIADHHRRGRREARRWGTGPSDAEAPAADPAEDPTACACAGALLSDLAPTQRQILAAVTERDAPVAQIARELGITAGAAHVRLHRARVAMKARLAAHCGTDSPRAVFDCACDEHASAPA